MLGDDDAMNTVGHAYMLAAGDNAEPRFFECLDRALGGNISEQHCRSEYPPQPDRRGRSLFLPQSCVDRLRWRPEYCRKLLQTVSPWLWQPGTTGQWAS